MPNMKNAKKKVKTIAKEKALNNDVKSSMKTAIKNVEKAVKNNDKKEAEDKLKVAIKKIDKATSKKVISKNTNARKKSNLTKKVNSL